MLLSPPTMISIPSMEPKMRRSSTKSSKSKHSTMSSSHADGSVGQILKQHDKGLRQLEQEKYSKAIQTLSSSLTQLKELIANVSSSSHSNSDLAHLSFGYKFQTIAGVTQTTTPSTTTLFRNLQSNSNSNMPNSLIQVVVEDAPRQRRRSRRSSKLLASEQPQDHSQSLAMVSFAVLYNLGTAVYLSALHSSSASSGETPSVRRLHKALAIYQTAHSLILNTSTTHAEDPTAHANANGWNVLEKVALWDNMSQVHRLLRQYVSSQPQPEEEATSPEQDSAPPMEDSAQALRQFYQQVFIHLLWVDNHYSRACHSVHHTSTILANTDSRFAHLLDQAAAHVLSPVQSAAAA